MYDGVSHRPANRFSLAQKMRQYMQSNAMGGSFDVKLLASIKYNCHTCFQV